MTLNISRFPFIYDATTQLPSNGPLKRPEKAEISYLIHADSDPFKNYPMDHEKDYSSGNYSSGNETYSSSDNYSSGNESDSGVSIHSTQPLRGPQRKQLSKIRLKNKLKEKIQTISDTHLKFKPENKTHKQSAFHRIWMQHYQELLEYKNQKGHCSVRKSENKQLGEWVSQQRRKFSKGDLLKTRFDLLRKIGFEFGDLATVYKNRKNIEFVKLFNQRKT
jgi:hypothetical protein